MRIVLFGPPGAGKGTQAHRLADRMDLALIATGDIFRANVANDTDLGREAKSYMDKGELVPDDVVVRMVVNRLDEEDAHHGFIMDGFPRTLPQAQALPSALIAKLCAAPPERAVTWVKLLTCVGVGLVVNVPLPNWPT